MFKIGDVVYLNSGSPELTVIEMSGEEIQVSWMRPDGTGYVKMIMPAVCFTKSKPTAYLATEPRKVS